MSSLTPEFCKQLIKTLGEKHIMCSYQWNVQKLVTKVYEQIESMGIPVWMDIKGGVYGNMNAAMAAGVENAAVICPFMTEDYEKSKSCELELNYARDRNVNVVPCMTQTQASDGSSYRASGWLGALTAGKLWLDFRNADGDEALITERVDSLLIEIARQFGVDAKNGVQPVNKPDQPKKVAIKWVPYCRDDEIPHNAVYAGTTRVDGKMYVARVNNTPGKVNLSDGTNKIWNFWVEGLGRSSSGEILTANGSCTWIDIKHGELIPNNAVFSGRDHCNDKVWVARDKRGEPGKLNCHDNDSENPKMHNLWCHNSRRNREGEILTIS